MNRLEKLRDSQNLTKKKLANKLGVSVPIYARWENNRESIPTKRLSYKK